MVIQYSLKPYWFRRSFREKISILRTNVDGGGKEDDPENITIFQENSINY